MHDSKLEELPQNDSGISPSCSGDSLTSGTVSPASLSGADLLTSTPMRPRDEPPRLKLADNAHASPKTQIVAVQPSIRPKLPYANDWSRASSPYDMSANGELRLKGVETSSASNFSNYSWSSPSYSSDSNESPDDSKKHEDDVVKRCRYDSFSNQSSEIVKTTKYSIHCPNQTFTPQTRTVINALLRDYNLEECFCICDLTVKSIEELQEHYRTAHDVDIIMEFPNKYEGESRKACSKDFKPKVCKQCGEHLDSKEKFYAHLRLHTRKDRLLACDHCPFVTEYKHHFEYHMRNHLNSKPFKCTKCKYECVNKSMLNSHLKSHSNIYQFRCNDCVYATKYCHSLKLHLRKYSHQPAMVLNPDGTPNPLPIVDVYGTRRGPKQKTKASPVSSEKNLSMIPRQLTPDGVQFPLVEPQLRGETRVPSVESQFHETRVSPAEPQFQRSDRCVPSTEPQFPSSPSKFPSPNPQLPNFPVPSQFLPKVPSGLQYPTTPAQFPPGQTPLPMLLANYALFPPTQLPFPFPFLPGNIPLSLFHLDIPALYEKAKQSAETMEKFNQIFQMNTENIPSPKDAAMSFVKEHVFPQECADNLSAPLDLSKTATSTGSNRRKSKAVKRIVMPSIFKHDMDGEKPPICT